MEEKTTLGKFISKKRKEKNMTQKELAEQLYVTESAVSKWERGISYPDISLVTALCEVLEISEHELVTASEDYRQREIERQAKKYRRISPVYFWITAGLYGVALLTCFICNLAVNHTLSWFWIVLTSIMAGFSLTTLPVLLKKKKCLWTLTGFFISLNLLLMVCAIFTGGDWFGITFISLLFGFSVVFLPLILRGIPLPEPLSRHKTLMSFVVDTLLLFALVWAGCAYTGESSVFLSVGLPSALACLPYPWFLMLAIRYLKINPMFKTSICLFFSGIFSFLITPLLRVISNGVPFSFPAFNLSVWNEFYLNGNIQLIILLSLIFMSVLFCAGGIVLALRRQKA